jgi:hypothetical protein
MRSNRSDVGQHVFCADGDPNRYGAAQAAAEAGMQQKSAEFRERGGDVYLPADVVRAEAEETVAAD